MGFNLQAEWENVSGAPLLFLGTVIVVGGVIWLFFHLLYRARIERLEQDVKSEQAENARLRGRLDELEKSLGAQSAPTTTRPPTPAADEKDKERRRRQNAALQLANARSDARAALASRRGFTSAVANMESALITLQKVYGIKTPKRSQSEQLDLQTWLRFLDDVWPLLQHGHLQEGRDKAAELTKIMNAQIDEYRTPF